MLKRKKEIMIWLTEDELIKLKEKVGITGLSMQSYLRHLIASVQPKERPSAGFIETLKLLRQISNNMNQIAMKANSNGLIDAQEYKKNVRWLQSVIGELMEVMYR